MNGIDISNYQYGINLDAVPCDFVIILVTENGSVVNGDWRRQCDQALSDPGKCVALYNYIGGYNASGEADVFWNTTKDYSGRVVYAVDWELNKNSAWGNLSYLDTLVKRLKSLSGRTVLLYGPAGDYPRSVASANGCPTWVAQYANDAPTGYQSAPWNQGAYQADIRQYSSNGQLDGWNGGLDLDLSYVDRSKWLEWAGSDGSDMAISDADAQKIAQKVWGYNWNNTASGGNMYNTVGDILTLLKRLPGLIWAYAWKDGKTGKGEPDGGNMYNSAGIMQTKLDKLQATCDAQTTAIKVLANAMGADPQDIAKAVSDAVNAKLNKTIINIEAKEIES